MLELGADARKADRLGPVGLVDPAALGVFAGQDADLQVAEKVGVNGAEILGHWGCRLSAVFRPCGPLYLRRLQVR